MKVFISADIEGVSGITDWSEANPDSPTYPQHQLEMTKEVAAACEGALRGGAESIFIKDAHWTGRNLLPELLPEKTNLIRGWSGHPYCMVQELDSSFDALLFVGYHSAGGTTGNPLAHTLNSKKVDRMRINGEVVSEFLIHTYIAAMHRVPVVFISGDQGICQEAKSLLSSIHTVETSRGIGASTISKHPKTTRVDILEMVESSLDEAHREQNLVRLPGQFDVDLQYLHHQDAYRASFYPGATLTKSKTINFKSSDYMHVITFLGFVI